MNNDIISRQVLLDAVDSVDWYHQNKNGEMVHGANTDEHQAWYKAEDIYKAIESVPPVQLAQDLPKGCTDTISRQAAVETVRKVKSKGEAHRMLIQLPSAQPGCEDTVPRTSVEYICRKNTVSTNPYEHKYHDKFIQFMDDPEISDFGRWQHSNGFNTALVAVQCDLDKVPPVTPKQPGWTYIKEALPKTIINEHTHDYQEYNCLCDFGDNGFDVRTYKFGSGHFWNGGGIVDKYVTAWQPLPEIPDALKQKPWEGGQDGKN